MVQINSNEISAFVFLNFYELYYEEILQMTSSF